MIRTWLVCGTFSVFYSRLPLLFLSTLSLLLPVFLSLSPSISTPSVSAKLKVCCGRVPGCLIHIKDTAIIYIMPPHSNPTPSPLLPSLFSLYFFTPSKAFSLILYFLLCLLHYLVFLSSFYILCCFIHECQTFYQYHLDTEPSRIYPLNHLLKG